MPAMSSSAHLRHHGPFYLSPFSLAPFPLAPFPLTQWLRAVVMVMPSGTRLALVSMCSICLAQATPAAAALTACTALPAHFIEARTLWLAHCQSGSTRGAMPVPDLPVPELPGPVSVAYPALSPAHPAPSRRAAGRLHPTPRLSSGPASLPQGVAAVAEAHRIDPLLLDAIVRAESAYRVTAVSPAGALGLLQVMPATARDLGVADPGLLLQDPLLALDTGARYLKRMQQRFGGNLPLVLASYNAGPGAVERHGGIPPYRETRLYVRRILEAYARSRSDLNEQRSRSDLNEQRSRSDLNEQRSRGDLDEQRSRAGGR